MTRIDRWIVAGAWALLSFSVSIGTWKISSAPRVEPWIVECEERWEIERTQGRGPLPPLEIPRAQRPEGPGTAGLEKADPWACFIRPTPVYVVDPLPRLKVQLLPRACETRATADLGGAGIAWELEDVPEGLPPHVKQESSKPAAILVERAPAAGGKATAIASLDPKATRYVDLTAEPNQAYRYWVVVVGPEVVLAGRDAVRKEPDRRKEPAGDVTVRTPPIHRVAIVGGDLQVAILRVERYDRALKAWTSKVVNAKPGEKIGTSGWTLDGLRKVPARFGTQALVADATDETGAKRIIAREE